MREGRAEPEAAERALVRKPQIGDTRPAPVTDTARVAAAEPNGDASRTSQARQDAAAAPVARPPGQPPTEVDAEPTPRDATGQPQVATLPAGRPTPATPSWWPSAAGASARAARSVAT